MCLIGRLCSRAGSSVIFLIICFFSADASAKGTFMLSDFQISPDGQVVAFQYQDKPQGLHGLGLLNLETGALTRIPSPQGKHLGSPSFSYDGKKLAAVIGENRAFSVSQIVVIDLATLQLTQVTEGRAPRYYPVFQPGTDQILYVVGGLGVSYHLRLLNISDHTETTVLKKQDGFLVVITRPSFVTSNELIFQAISPSDSKMKESVKQLTGSEVAQVSYHLQFGGRPEIYLPQLESKRRRSWEPGMSWLSASENGKEVVVVHLSNVEPRTKGVGYNYELFKLENGKLKQMTNVRSHIQAAHVSYKGSKVAFGSDSKRRREWDLFVLDMKTGIVQATNLLKRLATHPEFASN